MKAPVVSIRELARMQARMQPPKCRRHLIANCPACTKPGYSNVTLAPPRHQKPHIAFVLGWWRVSSMASALKATRDPSGVLDRWEKAHRLVNVWNAHAPELRALAPWIWPIKL